MTHVVRRLTRTRVWHHGPPLLLVAVFGLLVWSVPAEETNRGHVLVAVAVLQAGLVLCWAAALGLRGYIGALLIGGGAAAAADTVAVRMVAADRDDDRLAAVAAVLALAFLLAFVHQLSRRAPRDGLTESLSGVTLQTAVVVAPAAFLVLADLPLGPELWRVAAVGLAVALAAGHLVDLLLPVPRIVAGVPRGLLGFLAGTGAGMYAAVELSGSEQLVEQLGGLILGGVLGGVVSLLGIGASYVVVDRRGLLGAQSVVQAALPLAAAAPVAYFVTVLVAG